MWTRQDHADAGDPQRAVSAPVAATMAATDRAPLLEIGENDAGSLAGAILMVPCVQPSIPAHAMQALADGAARWRTRGVASAPLVEAAGWVMLRRLASRRPGR